MNICSRCKNDYDLDELAYCLICNNYYCNNITKESGSYSDIYNHIKKKFHKTISIKGSYNVECQACSCNNIYLLMFRDDKILCTDCCTEKNTFRYILDEKHINEDLLKYKKEKVMTNYKHLEEDVREVIYNSFQSSKDYVSTFMKAIKLEEQTEIRKISAISKHRVLVDFLTMRYKKKERFVMKLKIPIEQTRIKFGDQFNFKFSNEKYLGTGTVFKIDEYLFALVDKCNFNSEDGRFYTNIICDIEFQWNNVTYHYMGKAVDEFFAEFHNLKHPIKELILRGKNTGSTAVNINEEILVPPYLNNIILNANQNKIIYETVFSDQLLHLIQGPPGTGKTVLSSIIIYNLYKKYGEKILVVAPSNIAVDNIAKLLLKFNLNCLRVVSYNKGMEIEQIKDTMKNNEDFENMIKITLLDIVNLKKNMSNKKKSEFYKITNGKIRSADIILTTCLTAGSMLRENFNIRFLLMDEAAQATEPLFIVPLMKLDFSKKNKIILVGDHKQLGPTILNQKNMKNNLQLSIFERLLNLKNNSRLLDIQYRMDPLLIEWPSNMFYNGCLKTVLNRYSTFTDINSLTPINILRNLKQYFHSTFLYASFGREQTSISGTSFINVEEADQILTFLQFLAQKNIKENNIGIITPYEGQRAYLLRHLERRGIKNIECKSVDGFQGKEKEFIIISLVRSNETKGIGFLKDERRLNVAMTRAKYGVYIFGNPNTFLNSSDTFNKFINFYQQRNLIVSGEITNLQPISIAPIKEKLLNKVEMEELDEAISKLNI